MRARIVTCASPAYLARAGTPRRPVDIEKHACVRMRDWRTGAPFAWELVRGEEVVKVNASGQLIVNDGGATFAACLGGHGLAQLLEPYARQPLADGRLVQVLPRWADETYPLYAYHAGSRHLVADRTVRARGGLARASDRLLVREPNRTTVTVEAIRRYVNLPDQSFDCR